MDSNDEAKQLELPLETVAPAQVEQVMVEKALTEDPTGLPQDKAAAFFKRGANELDMLLDSLSNRALKRMIMNVATYPYLDRTYEVKRDSTEFKAAYRFNEMVWQKTIMQLSFEAEKAEKALKDGKEPEQLTLTKGKTSGTTTET